MENHQNLQECQTDQELERALQLKLQALSSHIASTSRKMYQLDLITVDLYICSDGTLGIKYVLKRE